MMCRGWAFLARVVEANFLVFYIAGDNGARVEGGQNGMFNE